MNEYFKEKFRTDKLGVETDVAYINSLGVIHWKYRELISHLIPVQQLEFPKGLYLYIKKIEDDEE